ALARQHDIVRASLTAGRRGEHDRVTKPLQHFPADSHLGRIKILARDWNEHGRHDPSRPLAGRSGYQIPRGLDRALFLKLVACDRIAERRNLLLTGASGLGKSWLACALSHKACRDNMSVLYTRAPRLFADLAIADGDVCCVRYAVRNACYLRNAVTGVSRDHLGARGKHQRRRSFNVQRHLTSAQTHRVFRAEAMDTWRTAVEAA